MFELVVVCRVKQARKLVARAWVDAALRARLLDERQCNDVVRELLGIELGVRLVVVENTPTLHHVVVCTLCSCYPTQLLGRSPLWYKERAYRARVVREPRAVLREFGCTLDAQQRVRVVDSTSECRYFVLPQRPPTTADWSEEQLQTIVTRDSIIGVRKITL